MRLIEEQYLQLKSNGNYNNIEIAKMLNVSKTTIFNYQKKFNLKSDFKYNHVEKMSLYEESILIGTLLGDSWLTKSSKDSYRGGFSHKNDNKDYVRYKLNLLHKICVDKINFKSKKYGFPNAQNQFYVRFKASPLLKSIHDKLYINKVKEINDYVINHFTDISLALYYQDDGSKKKGKNGWYTYKIAMYSFDFESKTRLQKLLFEKWNIYSTVTKNELNIAAKSRAKFKAIVSPYIVGSMKYKL